MSDNLLQKLEEKMMTLISEVEELRKAMQYLTVENRQLKMEKENNLKKLNDLISLLDTVTVMDAEIAA